MKFGKILVNIALQSLKTWNLKLKREFLWHNQISDDSCYVKNFKNWSLQFGSAVLKKWGLLIVAYLQIHKRI